MIFSRRRGSTPTEAGQDADEVREGRHTRSAETGRYAFEPDDKPELPVPDFGPYDVDAAPDDGVPRLDLGALRIPNVAGTSLQLEAAPNGQIVRVQLEQEGSRLQLGAFAAPRTEGIWDEVRAELRTALLSSGAKVVDVEGEYGPTLAARFAGGGPNAGVIEVRHIGIDGPRWFVHCVLVGPAAVDPERAGALHQVLRGLIVDRGSEARPVKEALPLRLPAEYQAKLTEMAAAKAAQAANQPPGTLDAAQQIAAQQAAARSAATPTPARPASAAPRKTATRRERGESA